MSPVGPEVLVFSSHCSSKFQLILDCFKPNFKLTHEDSENIKRLFRYNRFQLKSNQT